MIHDVTLTHVMLTDYKRRRWPRHLFFIGLCCLVTSWVFQTDAFAQSEVKPEGNDLEVSQRIPIADGYMVVCRKKQRAPATHLLIHFHGAPETVQNALRRSRLDAVLAIVNFPGLSSAYSTPFAQDERLFDRIVAQASKIAVNEKIPLKAMRWNRMTVSSFSAGFGAVRQILTTEKYFKQIDALVAADSIYAGIQTSSEHREVNQQNMQDFLKFARKACAGKKTFIISHSSQLTSYASTTETADYLLRALRVHRRAGTSIESSAMRQTSMASKGQFTVLGFEGETGKDHMQHLHNIDLLWDQLDTHVSASHAFLYPEMLPGKRCKTVPCSSAR